MPVVIAESVEIDAAPERVYESVSGVTDRDAHNPHNMRTTLERLKAHLESGADGPGSTGSAQGA